MHCWEQTDLLCAWNPKVQVDAIHRAHELSPQMKSKPKATKQVQSLLDGIETKHKELEDAAPKEADEMQRMQGCHF